MRDAAAGKDRTPAASGGASRAGRSMAETGTGGAPTGNAPSRTFRLLRDVMRVVTGAVLMSAVLSGVHVRASDPTEGAVLRIALRTSAGTAQICRRVSQEELDRTPVHMRRAEICETHAVPYRLQVQAGPKVLIDRTYHASGLHGDRPLTVNENLMLAAGRHDVSIRFAPSVPEDMTNEKAAALPPAFTFASAVDFPEGRIRVAVLDTATGAFEIR